MHQFVIDEVGPLLTDERVSRGRAPAPGREQVHKALAEERLALVGRRARRQLVQDVTDDVLGYGPIDRFLRTTRASPKSW